MEIEDGTWQIANCAGAFLASAPITSWQRGEEKSFRTHSEKSLSLPEANLSVWGTLAAAPHLHKHNQHSLVPHSSPWIAASGIGAGARARAEAIPCVRAGCYSACCRLSTPQQRHTPLWTAEIQSAVALLEGLVPEPAVAPCWVCARPHSAGTPLPQG